MPKKKNKRTPNGDTPPRRTSRRGAIEYPKVSNAKIHYNDESLEAEFRALCNLKPDGKGSGDRKMEKDYYYLVNNQQMNTDDKLLKKYSKSYGNDLGKLMSANYVRKVKVPQYLVHRAMLNQFPIYQSDPPEKQQRHNEIQNESVEFNIQFGNISETEIPKVVNGKIESVKAGNNLTNDDLFNAFKLVGYNLGNIGVVLLLIYQYNSNMWNKTTIKRTEDKEVEKKLIRVFSQIDNTVESNLSTAPSLQRIIWTLYSFAKKEDDCHFEEEIKQHRQNSRELLLEQLVKWKYDREAMSDQTRKDYHLERCFAFHVFTIMSGSQGTKDEDGIDRLNQLISGDRTGPFSICRALQHSPFEKCVDFFVKLLNSGKNQGMQKSRVTIFLELAIYFETVWLKETPTNYYDLCRIYGFAQKKARVSVNAIGVSDGVGIDEHVKRFLNVVLGLNYNINDLYALLSNLPPRICLNVNDNIGEIGMKLNNIKRKEVKNDEEKRKQEADRIWITHLFSEMRVNPEMNEICDKWLDAYDVKSKIGSNVV